MLKNCEKCSKSQQADLSEVEVQLTELTAIVAGDEANSTSQLTREPGLLAENTTDMSSSRRYSRPLTLGEEMSTADLRSSGVYMGDERDAAQIAALGKQVVFLKDKLQQAEEEGSVLANQLRRAKEELLQEVSDRLQHVFT